MSLSLGAIGRMSGENDDTTSQTSLGACHPDESNKHMKHFEITDINEKEWVHSAKGRVVALHHGRRTFSRYIF